MAFSKLRAFLKKTAAQTKEDLWDAIAEAIETFTPIECENDFAAAGYDRDRSENTPASPRITADIRGKPRCETVFLAGSAKLILENVFI